ncbi:GMC oxidoreductase [Alkalihalobacillus deserti]|uniref:GMC oxidoreductase n=1 Tax=Alkalihalobacillus deserti TaxID=2879466 RepID=UPI001D15960C|nr:GMC family oxidoreductase [Alkalihalobacillus deserti]
MKKLIDHNPHLSHPDEDISGQKVKVPSLPKLVTVNRNRQITNETIVPTYEDCPPSPDIEFLDHWFPLTSLEDMEKIHYDVIIIGSGAGGGAALWRLCEQWQNEGKRIAVLERGDLLLPTHVANLPTAKTAGKFLQNPAFHIPRAEEWPEFPGAKQFFGLGGRTLQWGGAVPRFHPADFREWPLKLDDLVQYYQIAEQVMKVTTAFIRDSDLHYTLLERLRKNGYHDATTIPRTLDLHESEYGQIRSNVLFSSIEFIAWAFNWNPFDLAVRANVVKILHENGKARGVQVMSPDLKSYTIHGKNVVVSGSTFETPRLLLHSGIPGKAIGRYLINHSFVSTRGFVAREDFEEVLGIANILLPSSKERPYQIQVHGPFPYEFYAYETKPLMTELEISLFGFGIVEPNRDNRVVLDQTNVDTYGVPKLNVHFSYGAQDLAVIEQMVDEMHKAIESMNLDNITSPCLFPPGLDFHEAGTCRMGIDPSTSVTNEFGQVHGMSGLFVADNSILPFMGGANPTLTTIAIAMRTADYIVEKETR